MNGVNRDELIKIPYIDNVPLDGREVHLYSYFDEVKNNFIMHIPDNDGKLLWILAEPGESFYYAKSKSNDLNDIYLDFNNILIQNYSYNSINYYHKGVVRDLLNCSTFFEKYFIFHELYLRSKDIHVSSLINTELEYFFGNIRSMFDLLQKIIKDLWKRETRKDLPSSFADIVKLSDKDLKLKYDLSDSLIKYYRATESFFMACKQIRDDIHHSGKSIDYIFCDNDGFAISNSDPTFSQFKNIWPTEKVKANSLVSLLALVSFITIQTITYLENLSLALIESFPQEQPISNTYKVILKGPYINHFNKLDKYLEEQWYVQNKN